MSKYIPSQAELKDLLVYDPETGHFTWKWRSEFLFPSVTASKIWNHRQAGRRAGRMRTDRMARRVIILYGKPYYEHHLVWIYMAGSKPLSAIDHINHDACDNRWVNLRLATGQENSRNMSRRSDNSSGVTGVWWDRKLGKWCAEIHGHAKEKVILGYFLTLDEARVARKAGEAKYGYHPNHGAAKCAIS